MEMLHITKLHITNFKRFKELELDFNPKLNTIIGDNEAGKSSILNAIEFVTSGSRNKVENAGLESLFNKECVADFLDGKKSYENLPELHIELYLNDETNLDLVGNHNSHGINTSGLHMVCEPNGDLGHEIKTVLGDTEAIFPFEFYIVRFFTFSGEAYSGYRHYLKCLTIDSSQINGEYANREYIKSVYRSSVDFPTRANLKNEYRKQKASFKESSLKTINDGLGIYDFALRSGTNSNLETDITLTQDNIPIDERGKGQQCFIKTEFALSRNSETKSIDTILLEEPENHLSHTNMNLLISKISESHQNQIIIATHSSLISTRLNLKNSILLNSASIHPLTLRDLPNQTAKFFMKAPDNNILEFVLSKKVILVEGDAEYILFDYLYGIVTGRSLETDRVHVISVGGTSFKRYMELAKTLCIRTAVVRDNDGDYQRNCIENYENHINEFISVFSNKDNDLSTFELCIYEDNKAICESLFSSSLSKSPIDFMLKNKAESAIRLAENNDVSLKVPEYIEEAISWINE